MINTTDFLDTLRCLEYVVEKKNINLDLRVQLKKQLLNELSKVRKAINNMDLGDEMECLKAQTKHKKTYNYGILHTKQP